MTLEFGPKSFDELEATALNLIDLIYEAAVDPAHWNEFLRAYGELYPGASQWLWLEDRRRADVRILMNEACDRSFVSSYERHFAATNPWTEKMLALPEGHVHVADQLAPRDMLVAGEFYNDWLRPQDLWDGFGCCILKFGRHFMFYSLVHNKRATTTERDLRLLRFLVPHMQRAARLHSHFRGLEHWAAGAEAGLDQLSAGAMLCGPDGRVLFMNRTAEAIVRGRDGLAIERGKLIILTRDANRRLAAMIADVLREPPVAAVSEAALLVPRPSGGAPYALAVAPLPRRARVDKGFIEPGPAAPRFLVTICETEPQLPSAERLRSLFALTKAEAEVAAARAAGQSVESIAMARAVSPNTVRSQLKTIYDKLAVSSQAQFVAKLLAASQPAPIADRAKTVLPGEMPKAGARRRGDRLRPGAGAEVPGAGTARADGADRGRGSPNRPARPRPAPGRSLRIPRHD